MLSSLIMQHRVSLGSQRVNVVFMADYSNVKIRAVYLYISVLSGNRNILNSSPDKSILLSKQSENAGAWANLPY